MSSKLRIDADILSKVFWAAFEQFLREETGNIANGTSEQNLCGRLAMSLEGQRRDAGIEGYFVDTEYNRNGGQVKTIIGEQSEIVSIRCDIILHSRGQLPHQDNLIVVEMKRSNHPESEKQKDRIRLRAMTKATYDDVWSYDGETLPEHVCGYEIGFYLEVNRFARWFLVETYAAGDQVAARQLDF